MTEKEVPLFNKKVLGNTFKRDAPTLQNYVEGLAEAELLKLKDELTKG